MYGIGWKKTG